MLHPNSLFYYYKEKIMDLKKVNKYSVLNEQFSLYNDSDLQIYYAPHNEYINERAKILIVGITPGWSQTQRAYQTAKDGLEMHDTDENICFQCKLESRFAGTMRRNLITMLDELNLQVRLKLTSCADLFNSDNDLLHTTSLIKYPCFYKGKNYSGHVPAIGSVEILKKYIQIEFMEELRCMEKARLVIPLGAAVESVFREALNQSCFQNCEVLWGFPHPSGLNAHRKNQFQNSRKDMAKILVKCDI